MMVYKLSRGNKENRKETNRLRYGTHTSYTHTWVGTCNPDHLSVKDLYLSCWECCHRLHSVVLPGLSGIAS